MTKTKFQAGEDVIVNDVNGIRSATVERAFRISESTTLYRLAGEGHRLPFPEQSLIKCYSTFGELMASFGCEVSA